jgi:hypothetical protein
MTPTTSSSLPRRLGQPSQKNNPKPKKQRTQSLSPGKRSQTDFGLDGNPRTIRSLSLPTKSSSRGENVNRVAVNKKANSEQNGTATTSSRADGTRADFRRRVLLELSWGEFRLTMLSNPTIRYDNEGACGRSGGWTFRIAIPDVGDCLYYGRSPACTARIVRSSTIHQFKGQ